MSLYILLTSVFLLIADKWDSSLTFFGAMLLLILLKIVTLQEALEGFANPAVATIAILFVVAKGVEETVLLEWVVNKVLRHPRNTYTALLRFLPVVILLSAFTNNTPVVLIFIRVLQSWSVRVNLPLTRLLMPLSFSSIFGGSLTIIGTSTNLVVQGLAGDSVDLGFFDIAMIGAPLAVIGMLYMVFLAKFLLPATSSKLEYMPLYAALHVAAADSDLPGRGAIDAGLCDLPGTILVRIKREVDLETNNDMSLNSNIYRDVSRNEEIAIGDLFFFVGMAECIAHIPGLTRSQIEVAEGLSVVVFECFVATDQFEISKKDFEEHFECRVLRVTRDGDTVSAAELQNIQGGDVVVVEGTYAFIHHSNAPQFQKVILVEKLKTPKQTKLRIIHPWAALVLVVTMVVLAATNLVPLFAIAGLVAILMISIGILSWNEALRSVGGRMLLLISASFTLALALERTGVASNIANGMSTIFKPGGQYTQLMGIYVATNLLTCVISNAAASAVMFPIIVSVVNDTGLNIKAALYTLMIAASFAFTTPIGYQTNLMVEAAGGYTWWDFFKFGGPISVLCALITPALAMAVWPATTNTTIITQNMTNITRFY